MPARAGPARAPPPVKARGPQDGPPKRGPSGRVGNALVAAPKKGRSPAAASAKKLTFTDSTNHQNFFNKHPRHHPLKTTTPRCQPWIAWGPPASGRFKVSRKSTLDVPFRPLHLRSRPPPPRKVMEQRSREKSGFCSPRAAVSGPREPAIFRSRSKGGWALDVRRSKDPSPPSRRTSRLPPKEAEAKSYVARRHSAHCKPMPVPPGVLSEDGQKLFP